MAQSRSVSIICKLRAFRSIINHVRMMATSKTVSSQVYVIYCRRLQRCTMTSVFIFKLHCSVIRGRARHPSIGKDKPRYTSLVPGEEKAHDAMVVGIRRGRKLTASENVPQKGSSSVLWRNLQSRRFACHVLHYPSARFRR